MREREEDGRIEGEKEAGEVVVIIVVGPEKGVLARDSFQGNL